MEKGMSDLELYVVEAKRLKSWMETVEKNRITKKGKIRFE